REALSSDGNEAACERAGASDSAPPKDCAAPIRIELQPLGKPAAAAPELKPAELGAKRLGLYRQDSWYLDSPPKLDRGFILKLLTKEQKSLAERVFHAEDAMKTAEQKRRELPGKLDSCIKSSCPKRAELEAQSGPLEQRYWSAVAAYHDMARAVSEPLLKAVAAAPSAAAHLMASENEDIAQMAVALEAHASTASPDAEAHRLEAARQLMQARDSAAGDEELLRVVLWRLGAVSSGAEAVTAFERLSRLGSLRSDERGRVHIKLGSALEAVGRLDEADATLAWEDAKPGHWTHAVKVFVRTRIALKQNQCQRVLALTAEGIDAFLRAPQRGFASQVHTESAADCVERLGGLDRAPFRGSPLAFAYLAMTVAERAVEREDLDEAIRAWRLVVERARSTIIAAEALAALVGAYDALGNPARAEELWGERKSFTVASLDAESNAGRTFTREDIERALTIPGFRTSSNSDDLGERVEPALRSVLEPCFVGHTLPKPAKVSVAVRVRSSRGELQASASDGSALPEEALACTRRLGAARFAVWDRPFKVEVELSTDGVARGWL
ncbi:MAG TPA: hypothetical protein VM686_16670, partial [Polyangiaceae bacterium]|nr:hypothetical protein [Polyangiaceae bacterium]